MDVPQPAFSICVGSRAVDAGWEIDARVEYLDDATTTDDGPVDRAREHLLHAVFGEALGIRNRVGTPILVNLDTGDGVSTIDLDELVASVTPPGTFVVAKAGRYTIHAVGQFTDGLTWVIGVRVEYRSALDPDRVSQELLMCLMDAVYPERWHGLSLGATMVMVNMDTEGVGPRGAQLLTALPVH